jgi:hypothetical protein
MHRVSAMKHPYLGDDLETGPYFLCVNGFFLISIVEIPALNYPMGQPCSHRIVLVL